MEYDSPREGHKLHFFDYYCEDLWGCNQSEGKGGKLVNLNRRNFLEIGQTEI